MTTQITGVTLDTKVLDRMTAEIKPKARAVVNKYGLAIAGEAAKLAPVDTAALRNSILSESMMTGDMTFTVQDGVEYGVFVEFGHTASNGRLVAAQPFLTPAIESWRDKFLVAFEDLFK